MESASVRLLEAARLNDVSTVIECIEQGSATVDVHDSSGATPLFLAAEEGAYDACRALLERGANVSHLRLDGVSAVCMAASRDHSAVCELLVEHGAELNPTGPADFTALIVAIQNANEALAQFFVEHGADPNGPVVDGATPLCCAARAGMLPTCTALLKAGAVVDRVTPDGTALYAAVENGHADVVALLLQYGANPNIAVGSDGSCALVVAAAGGFEDVVRLLLKTKGIEVDKARRDGGTALCLAVQQGFVSITQALISAGAAVDVSDDIPVTPLMTAAYHGHGELVSLLLNNGADYKRRDKQSNFTAREWAEAGHHYDIAALILRHIAMSEAVPTRRTAALPVSLLALGRKARPVRLDSDAMLVSDVEAAARPDKLEGTERALALPELQPPGNSRISVVAGMTFPTMERAMAHIREYALHNHFTVVKTSVTNQDGRMKRVVLRCSRSGAYRPRGGTKRPAVGSSGEGRTGKTECPFRVYLRSHVTSGMIVISSCTLSHNHALAPTTVPVDGGVGQSAAADASAAASGHRADAGVESSTGVLGNICAAANGLCVLCSGSEALTLFVEPVIVRLLAELQARFTFAVDGEAVQSGSPPGGSRPQRQRLDGPPGASRNEQDPRTQAQRDQPAAVDAPHSTSANLLDEAPDVAATAAAHAANQSTGAAV